MEVQDCGTFRSSFDRFFSLFFSTNISSPFVCFSRQDLVSRINESKRLNKEYQSYFHKTKGKLQESANERQWNFRFESSFFFIDKQSGRFHVVFSAIIFFYSENYIFGKFDTFCKRLDRIVDVLNTIESLSGLQNIRVEGLEPIVVKYRSVVDSIKKKSYDLLDHRKPDVRRTDFISRKRKGNFSFHFSSTTIMLTSNRRSSIFKRNFNPSSILGSENLTLFVVSSFDRKFDFSHVKLLGRTIVIVSRQVSRSRRRENRFFR